MIRSTILLAAVLICAHPAVAQSPFWQPSNGPFDARLISIVQTPNGSLFTRTNKLVFRSTNGGAQWDVVGHELYGQLLRTLVVTPRGSPIAIDNMGEVWRSDDNGDTWT